MRSRRSLSIGLLAAALVAPPGRAEDPERATPRWDPFAALRPSVVDAAGLPTPASVLGGTPRLTGTVVAGPASLADLGGVILGIGEEANGYRLVEVRSGEVILERDGTRLVLTTDPATPGAER